MFRIGRPIRGREKLHYREMEALYLVKEVSDFDCSAILPLYAAVGWTNYTDRPEMLKNAFAHSLLVLGAYDGDRLAGLLRAVGDGFSVVFVQDVLVYPEYQRQGIGTQLFRTLMERFPDVYQMELAADDSPKAVAFYQSLGFVRYSDMGCCGFMRM